MYESLFIAITFSLLTLYFIMKTILLDRKDKCEVLIRHWTYTEGYFLVFAVFFCIKNIIRCLERSENEFIFYMFLLPIILVVGGFIAKKSREQDKKITVINSAGTEIITILCATLQECNIPYTDEEIHIGITNTSSYIRYQRGSLLIFNYRNIPNHELFLNSLEKNLKKAPYVRDRKQEISLIRVLSIFSVLFWGALIFIYIYKR